MKKSFISRIAGTLLIIICQVVACTSPQTNVNPVSDSGAYREGTLSGERVLIPVDVPDSAFYNTLIQGPNKGARVAVKNTLSLDELVDVLKPYVDKYPDLSQNPLRKADLKQIFHDFPDVKDEKGVREKSDLVVQYYNGLIKTYAKPEIEKAVKRKAGGRQAARKAGFGDLNPLEQQDLITNALMAGQYRIASRTATSETLSRFGTDADGVRANAFKHAIWNCLIARAALFVGYSKNNAILFTRNITSDHECDENGVRRYSNDEAMDLHNNLSARSWFGNNSSGSVWPFYINAPSEADIFDAWYHAATTRNFHICNPATTITAMFSWDFLYGTDRSDMGDKLYFYQPILPGC